MGIEEVILVDEFDRETGRMEKLEAHERGVLHRAFSVFIFNSRGEMLLQKRALSKYHSPGKWTNTCCSHQRPGESSDDAVHRRLMEEMGFDCPVRYLFPLVYRAEFENGLIEHELDHVFTGFFDGKPKPNDEEVCDWKFEAVSDILVEIKKAPENFTPWFKIIMGKLNQKPFLFEKEG